MPKDSLEEEAGKTTATGQQENNFRTRRGNLIRIENCHSLHGSSFGATAGSGSAKLGNCSLFLAGKKLAASNGLQAASRQLRRVTNDRTSAVNSRRELHQDGVAGQAHWLIAIAGRLRHKALVTVKWTSVRLRMATLDGGCEKPACCHRWRRES